MTEEALTRQEDERWAAEVIAGIAEHLEAEEYRFHFLKEDCIELYLQGKNLTMKIQVFAFNRHLVVRAPEFLRNVDLRRVDVLELIVRLMNDYLDIRFELGHDGRSLSASVNHILEDAVPTRRQVVQALMVVACLVDDCYPRFMQVVYGTADGVPHPDGVAADDEDDLLETDDDPIAPDFPAPPDETKIN